MAEESGPLTEGDLARLDRIYVEPTNRCNLDCRTCMRHGWDEPLGCMDPGLFEKVMMDLNAFPGARNVFFGGFGEPLGHPRIAGMVARAKALGNTTELISNGIGLDDAMLGRLVAAGLDRLWVSIDGASPSSYADVRLGDHLPEIIANLERLKTMRGKPDLGISFVAMRRNIADLPAVVDLAQRLGASRFSLSNVEPYTVAVAEEVLYGRVLFEALPAGGCVMPRFDPSVSQALEKAAASFPEAFTFTALSPGQDGLCPFLRRRSLSVRWDGRIGPCLPLLHAHTVCLNGHTRTWPDFTFGSLRERDLGELWGDPDYCDFRRRLDEFSFAPCTTCNSCDLPSVNGEDCFGNLHPACGSCLWSQGFIQCP